jgi:hypothetical protein
MALSFNPMSCSGLGAQLVSNGTHRYGAYYTIGDPSSVAPEIVVCKQALGDPADQWTTFQITGAARTQMACPIAADMHMYPSIGLLGDGSLVLAGNMAAGFGTPSWKAIRCANPSGAFTTWAAYDMADFGGLTSFSYPTWIMRPDGSTRYYGTAGPTNNRGAGRTDSYIFDAPAGSSTFSAPTMLFKGLSVANGKGAGVVGDDGVADTDFNWSAYAARPYVEDLGGGDYVEHWFWTWRIDGSGPDRSDIRPSYMQYRSATGTWHASDGTNVTAQLPIDPINDTAVWMRDSGGTPLAPSAGETGAWGPAYVNGPFILLDPATKRPVALVGNHPEYLFSFTGAHWTQTQRGSFNSNTVMAGVSLRGRNPHAYIGNDLWYITGGVETSEGGINAAWPNTRLWAIKADGTDKAMLGGPIPTGTDAANAGIGTAGALEISYDPIAYRTRGVVEILLPINERPRLVSFGSQARMAVAP